MRFGKAGSMKLKKRVSLLTGAGIALAGSAGAFSGGWFSNDPYVGTIPSSYFSGEICQDAPIVHQQDTTFDVQEWAFDVVGVRDDGDPNTFISCKFINSTIGNMRCLGGLPDGRVLNCPDANSASTLPHPGDRVFMTFAGMDSPDSEAGDACDVVIERSFGQPNPACRVGSVPPPGEYDFPCNAGNSTPFGDNVIQSATVDTCYSFNKATGELRMSTWTGPGLVVQVVDSAGTKFTGVEIPSGSWSAITGAANGVVYFYVSSTTTSQSSIPIQVHDW